jgi:lipid-A-disaccharide synthase
VSSKKLKIGIIAAEHSGDRLGANLIKALKNLDEVEVEVEVFGLGGPEVSSLGISTPNGMKYQDLQVMGLVDPLLKLPKLLSIRKKLTALFLNQKIDIFIGVDSPEFNMYFHKKLNGLGIKTIQVVSPSVWGWRENRIKAISSYIDLTMCLFQFEHDYYLNKEMNSFFLGHPFSQLKSSVSRDVLEKYKLNSSQEFICILPGSRKSEILHMMPIFIQAAERIFTSNPNTFFLIPAASDELKALIQNTLDQTSINYQLTSSTAKDYLSISKIAIVTSGTASLEAAVLGSLPIICYKTNPFNYAVLSRMIKTPFIGLPNLLLQKPLFPELVQHELTPEAIVHHYQNLSLDPLQYQSQLEQMNATMRGEGFEEAARLLLSL